MNTKPQPLDFKKILDYLLPALVITLGLQLIRAFIPGLAWYLKDTVGIGTLSLIPYAFGTFFLGFLAAPLRRLAGGRGALWITAGGLALIRLIEQICTNPGQDFWFAIAGIGLFLNFVPIYIGHSRELGQGNSQRWTYGLVLGFAFDTALRGVFGARDLSTVQGIIPVVIVGILALLIFWTLWREPSPTADMPGDAKGKQSVNLIAIGSYLALQMLFFQSQGWVEEVAGLKYPLGFVFVMLGYLVAAWGLSLGFARPKIFHPLLALGLGIIFVFTIYSANLVGGYAILLLLLGQFFLGWGWAGIGLSNDAGTSRGLWRTTVAVTGGMVLFLILSFAYYAALDMALPIPRDSFPAAAAGIIGVLIFVGATQTRGRSNTAWNHAGAITAGGLVLVPLVCWALWGSGPSPAQPVGFPVKVMTYNIHSAFNVAGSQDLESIAKVIEDSGADIIGLQEVSRVRLMDGAADMPRWLANRLDMSYVFQGTEEPIWGNAILSRYPIIESGYGDLPKAGTLMKRGYLWALIDVGESEPLLVIVTHLHHLEEDSEVRQVQVPVILEFWNGHGHTVLLGDFNAQPDSREMELIAEAGLVDSWIEKGEGPGFSYASNDPDQRIDWIWHSPDLAAVEIEVIQTVASDHMPVLGTYEMGR